MSDYTTHKYLEEAAEHLREAFAVHERHSRELIVSRDSYLAEKRMEIADAFARLAAINEGIIPADLLTEVLQRAGVTPPHPNNQ